MGYVYRDVYVIFDNCSYFNKNLNKVYLVELVLSVRFLEIGIDFLRGLRFRIFGFCWVRRFFTRFVVVIVK